MTNTGSSVGRSAAMSQWVVNPVGAGAGAGSALPKDWDVHRAGRDPPALQTSMEMLS